MEDVTKILDGLKADSGVKNKYLKFPDASTFNTLVDLMKDASETPELLEEFMKNEDVKSQNDAFNKVLANINKVLATAEGSTKEMLEKEKERYEKKIKAGRKATLSFVLKFLLGTNIYKPIQALAAKID